MRDDGGNAFPTAYLNGSSGDYYVSDNSGMTLRDYFAAKAMGGAFGVAGVHALERGNDMDCAKMARMFYTMADAMIKERAK